MYIISIIINFLFYICILKSMVKEYFYVYLLILCVHYIYKYKHIKK